MQPNETINEKIRRIRRDKKWSQEDVDHQAESNGEIPTYKYWKRY